MGGPRHGGGGKKGRNHKFEFRWRRTKRRYSQGRKDVDQIQDEIKVIKQKGQVAAEVPDIDKPGMGQFKCLICSRYFVTQSVLTQHKRSKKHKKMLSPPYPPHPLRREYPPHTKTKTRRLKKVARPQYTQKEANKCGGLGTDDKEKPNPKLAKKLLKEKLRRKRQSTFGLSGHVQKISVDQL